MERYVQESRERLGWVGFDSLPSRELLKRTNNGKVETFEALYGGSAELQPIYRKREQPQAERRWRSEPCTVGGAPVRADLVEGL